MTIWVDLKSNTRRDQAPKIRSWVPGDGLGCASRSKKDRCGAPAAVIEWEVVGYRGATDQKVVVCAHHAAERIRNFLRGTVHPQPLSVMTEKIAREQVIAVHWDEYQEAIEAATKAVIGDTLAGLPVELQEQILANDIREDA